VVVMVGDEVTVKRLRKKGSSLFLEAANAAYALIPLTRQSPSPRILGTVVGLYRGLGSRRVPGGSR
jgi:SOS-response transcriptional repressor LexA